MNSYLDELNLKQKEAVISEDRRLLVLAGAGSGKTKTLLQKILYLISEKNVAPNNILAITFTRNAADEMIDRLILKADKKDEYKKIIFDKKISNKEKDSKRREYVKKYPWLSNITIKTFHGLCYSLIRKYGAKEFDNRFRLLIDHVSNEDFDPKKIANETPEEVIHKLVLIECENREYLFKLKRYILDHYIDKIRKIHKLGRVDYPNPYTTLKGDRVKSKSERDIADWLYRHDIEYYYEPEIAPGTFEFRPDFFIKEANVYLEHISKLSYPLKDKERDMKESGNKYVLIHEKETHDSNEFNKVMYERIASHIDRDLKNVSPLNIVKEFRGYEKYKRQFILDTKKLIDKIKVENRDFNIIYDRGLEDKHRRVRDFYQLAKPLFYGYKNYCVDNSYLDFNDLIIRTISLLKNHKDIQNQLQDKFKHILVDEFQDVNTLQVRLLKYILKDDNQLFCVGDDWQSIYGWRGSNVEYILKFENFFENSKVIKLDINYRSNTTIVNASNEVIKNNESRKPKKLWTENIK